MNKFKFYIINVFFSAGIGAIIEVIAFILREQDYISFYSLMKSMVIGAFIGTVSLFFLFRVFLRLRQEPVIGFLSNFLVVAVLTLVGAILDGIRTYQQYIDSRWFMVLIVAEFLSFFLTLLWYRQIMVYNKKLQLKQESLQDSNE
jgi:hypothetical protein